jgi:hypothetical protein
MEGILLHGGRMLLLFENAALPVSGRIVEGDRMAPWHVGFWPARDGGTVAIAVVDAPPRAGRTIVWEEGESRPLLPPERIDLAPDALVTLVRRAGLDPQSVFAFLLRHLVDGRPAGCAAARAHRVFAREVLAGTAEPDGFIEIIARPECGGVFLQGWALTLAAGTGRVTIVAEDLAVHEVEVALFERSDLLAPARGCCLFAKDWSESPEALTAIFFEQEGRLARLDVVPGPIRPADAALSTQHVADMLPRLRGPASTHRAFRRICRPRYEGSDTLSSTDAPVAAAVDLLLQGPDGGLLAAGWVLDPARRVEMAILKSPEGPYAPIHGSWARLPRPDLVAGFGGDPRFDNLLDPADLMHGFIVHVPVWEKGAELYLELVLDDRVLFLPLRTTPVVSADRLARLLPALAPAEPEFDRIVADHLAPFLGSLPRRPAACTGPTIALGQRRSAPRVQALLPIDRMSDLQPVFALLAGTPDAAMLDLTLIVPRSLARSDLRAIEDAFVFYELSGRLVVTPDGLPIPARLDEALAAAYAPLVLAWHPSALPRKSGWLGDLLEDREAIGAPGLLAPVLVYEDGSIFFAGSIDGIGISPERVGCGLLGYTRTRISSGAPREVLAAPADIVLVDRSLLAEAGGFSGRLFSGGFLHLDLARRLAACGARSWCSGRVVFWKLEDRAGHEADPVRYVLTEVDRALLARIDQQARMRA